MFIYIYTLGVFVLTFQCQDIAGGLAGTPTGADKDDFKIKEHTWRSQRDLSEVEKPLCQRA